MSRSLEMNAEEAKSTSCGLEIITETTIVSLLSSFPNGTSAAAFSYSPPAAPTGCPRGSPLQEHHVTTTLTPASPRTKQKRGREPSGVVWWEEWGWCRDLQAPRQAGTGRGLSAKWGTGFFQCISGRWKFTLQQFNSCNWSAEFTNWCFL